jgi:hypothetical protein
MFATYEGGIVPIVCKLTVSINSVAMSPALSVNVRVPVSTAAK